MWTGKLRSIKNQDVMPVPSHNSSKMARRVKHLYTLVLSEVLRSPLLPIIVWFVIWWFGFPNRYYHYPSYRYIEPSEDNWLVQVTVKEEEKSQCPIVPVFSTSDWEKFRLESNQEVEESQVESQPQSLIHIQDTLSAKRFPHESSWKPTTCSPVHNVTVIVPYRNRRTHFQRFITHIHPFLKLQKVSYRILVVEQMNNDGFNRAKLLNVGFAESQKRFPSDCYVFHDIDLVPEHLGNTYGCTKNPRLMSSQMNSWRFLSKKYFGGVVSMSSEQFQLINGYSNAYKGWGAEDDDLYNRVLAKNLSIIRLPPDISSYRMSPHCKDSLGGYNERLYENWSARWEVDGLNSLNYTVVTYKDGIGFTAIQAYV